MSAGPLPAVRRGAANGGRAGPQHAPAPHGPSRGRRQQQRGSGSRSSCRQQQQRGGRNECGNGQEQWGSGSRRDSGEGSRCTSSAVFFCSARFFPSGDLGRSEYCRLFCTAPCTATRWPRCCPTGGQGGHRGSWQRAKQRAVAVPAAAAASEFERRIPYRRCRRRRRHRPLLRPVDDAELQLQQLPGRSHDHPAQAPLAAAADAESACIRGPAGRSKPAELHQSGWRCRHPAGRGKLADFHQSRQRCRQQRRCTTVSRQQLHQLRQRPSAFTSNFHPSR